MIRHFCCYSQMLKKQQLYNEESLIKVLEEKAIQILHVFPKVGQVAVGFGFLR